MRRIVIINSKGGCGKTTIAVNLASYFAARGDAPVLMDYDPQGSSMRWFRKRGLGSFAMHGVAAYERDQRTTRTFRLRIPPMASHIVVDTPAALDAQSLPELTRDADKIIVPVLPSDIDVHACTRIIADLLLVAKVRRADNRIGVVANRIKRNTLMYRSLQRFLATLNVPVVATLRDSQNYIRSAELGEGIYEMKQHLVAEDLAQWQPLLRWLDPDAPAAANEAADRCNLPDGGLGVPAAGPLRGQVFGKTAG